MKNIYFIILSLLIIIYILVCVRKEQLSIKTSIKWLIASLIMLILSIFPYSLDWLAVMMNISYAPALFLTIAVVFLIMVDFNYSKEIEKLNDKINSLSQEISILKEKKNK